MTQQDIGAGQALHQPHLSLNGTLFHLTPPPSFLAWPFTELSPLAHTFTSSVPSSFLTLRCFTPYLLPHGAPPRSPSPNCTKLSSIPFFHMPHWDGSLSSAIHWMEVYHRTVCRVISGAASPCSEPIIALGRRILLAAPAVINCNI